MKYSFFLILMIFSINTYSQIELHIDTLSVSKIVIIPNPDVDIEGETEGPKVSLYCSIKNNTNNEIVLHPSKAIVKIMFNYKGEKYTDDFDPDIYPKIDRIVIKPQGTFKFSNTIDLIELWRHFWNMEKTDYTLEMLEILPTIRVSYSDQNVNIISTDIETVVIDYPKGKWYIGEKTILPPKAQPQSTKKGRK